MFPYTKSTILSHLVCRNNNGHEKKKLPRVSATGKGLEKNHIFGIKSILPHSVFDALSESMLGFSVAIKMAEE